MTFWQCRSYAVDKGLCGQNVLQSVVWLIDSATYLLIKIDLLLLSHMWTDGGIYGVLVKCITSNSATWHWLIVHKKVSGWDSSLCSCFLQTSIWAPSLGFTLLFGSLVVKTWRIYHIFGKITVNNLKKAQFKVKVRAFAGMYSTYGGM